MVGGQGDGKGTPAGIPERDGRILDLPSGPVWPWELAVPIALVGSQGDGGIKSAAPRAGRGLRGYRAVFK